MALPEFTEKDTHRFPTINRKVIAFARVLGWTVRWANQRKDIVLLISPSGSKKINVPTANLNYRRSEAMIRQIATHTGDGVIRSLINNRTNLMHEPDMAEMVGWLAMWLDAHPDTFDTPKETSVPIENVPLPIETEPAESKSKSKSPLVYDVVPYLIWYRDGKHLKDPAPSDRVVQRNWSDGHVDYACAFHGCTYTALAAAPVTSHNNFKHRRGDFKRTPQEGAKANAATLEVFPGDPNEKNEVLARVAELVAPWAAWTVDLRAHVDELQAALEAANARADAAEGDLKALRDLLGKY